MKVRVWKKFVCHIPEPIKDPALPTGTIKSKYTLSYIARRYVYYGRANDVGFDESLLSIRWFYLSVVTLSQWATLLFKMHGKSMLVLLIIKSHILNSAPLWHFYITFLERLIFGLKIGLNPETVITSPPESVGAESYISSSTERRTG